MENHVLVLTDPIGKRMAAVIEINCYNALLKRLENLRASNLQKQLPASKKEEQKHS